MNKALLHKVSELLNGRLLNEALLYFEECRVCPRFNGNHCSLLNELTFCQRLARGFCPEWSYSTADRFVDIKDHRIKIVFPTIALLCGGAERWLVELANGLDRNKYCVCIGIENFRRVDKALVERAKQVEFAVFGKKAVQKAMDAADITLSWCYLPQSKAKYSVFCSHGCDRFTDALVRENAGVQGYKFTAVSSVAAAPWVAKGPIHVIHNGCNTDRLKPKVSREKMRRHFKVHSNELLIGFISRLIPEKNPWIVAIAAHELRNRGVKAKAVFVGALTGVQQYKGCVYVDKTEDIGSILGALDCFMLPSNSEAFSLAITEAWLAGVPVVATPVGAIKELESIYGPMVVRLDTSPTEAVLEAVSEKNKVVVQNAFNVAHEHFTTKAMVTRWEDYFDELIRT